MADRQADRPLRLALYARVSTRDKDQDPELQLGAMRDYSRARGWGTTEYVDTAAAGDLAHRTAWARLLSDAAQRRIDRVLVWKLDRAFRSTLHALATLRDLEHAGVGFASLTQPELDTTSATGRLVFTILAAVAEMERELIADRVREGMRQAARRGARIGRPAVTTRPGFRWPLGAGPGGPRKRQRVAAVSGPPARDRHGDTRSASGGRGRQRTGRHGRWRLKPADRSSGRQAVVLSSTWDACLTNRRLTASAGRG